MANLGLEGCKRATLAEVEVKEKGQVQQWPPPGKGPEVEAWRWLRHPGTEAHSGTGYIRAAQYFEPSVHLSAPITYVDLHLDVGLLPT